MGGRYGVGKVNGVSGVRGGKAKGFEGMCLSRLTPMMLGTMDPALS